MKKLFLMIALVAMVMGAKAQIKLTYSGNVGMGIDPYWVGCKLRVAYGGNDFTFLPNHEGINFGGHDVSDKNATRIDFWHPTVKWNKVRFKGYTLGSDSILKTEIMPLGNVTDILKQIKTYSYYFKSDCIDTRQRDYGVLAQELGEILPELIDTAKGDLFVNYNAFFAFLIKGFNEQQVIIEAQQNTITQFQVELNQQQGTINQQQIEIGILQDIAVEQEISLMRLYNRFEELREILNCFCGRGNDINPKCCESVLRQDDILPQGPNNKKNDQNKIPEEAVLYQNTPNPFSSNTEISCDIPAMNKNAFIYIYNLQGVELMSFPIVQKGFSTVVVSASKLPAGMYLYTLVVDDEIVDTKRMILTK